MDDQLVLYRDTQGGWRWRRTAPNHEPVAASTESYHHKTDAIANLLRVNGPNVTYTTDPNLDEDPGA